MMKNLKRVLSTNCLQTFFRCFLKEVREKQKKSVLFDYTEPTQDKHIKLNNKTHVIDNDFLLHRVIWQIAF